MLHHTPDDVSAWEVLGVVGGGEVYEKAYTKKECYEQVLHHKPDGWSAWYNLGTQGGGKVSDKVYTMKECYE